MKKHENAIKMLMKNAIDTKTLYGWYEDDNGARLLTNGHLIIKLSGATLDYIGDFSKMNDRNDNKRFVNQMNDIIELAKKGEYKTTVNIQDIKIFDKYNTDKKPFCAKYSNNSYIGFNPYYFSKINILTESDSLTITDNKKPMYIASNNVECILLPIMLDKNYNADNYAAFLEEVKSCYIQDEEAKEEKEKQKALKSADKIEKEVIYNGFYLYFAGRQLFIFSDKKRVTNDIINKFLKIMSDISGIDYINKITENDFKYYKSGVQAATITKTTSSYNYEIIRIQTKYNSEIFYNDEYNKLYIYNANLEKICLDEIVKTDICTDTDKAATKGMNETTTVILKAKGIIKPKKILSGYYMTFKNRDIFVASNEEAKRRYILQAFINEMINISSHLQNITEEKRNNILNDGEVLNETKKRITPATIEEICTSKENYIRITTNNGNTIINNPLNDFKTIIIDRFSANEGMTPKQKISFKFFSGISRLNNQLTETITQDIKKDLQADNRQTETTATAPTPATAKKTDKPKKAISLFVAVNSQELQPLKLDNLPKIEKYPTYASYFYSAVVKPLIHTKTGASVGSCAGAHGLGSKVETTTSGFLQPFNTS